MSKTVTAIYDNHVSARQAIELLKERGIRDTDLSVLASEGSIAKDYKIEENSKAPEGATIGASVGAVAGAAIAGLASVGAITLTGGLGLLAAGPVVAAFAGAGAGASAGGVVGGLIGFGIPETEAKLIDKKIGKGHVLVGVTVDDDEKDSFKNFLKTTNAEDINVH